MSKQILLIRPISVGNGAAVARRPSPRQHARADSAAAAGYAPKGQRMLVFSPLDLIAVIVFVVAWAGYAVALEWSPLGRTGLNAIMNGYRDRWMQQMLAREVRIIDAQLLGALHNGTAFFASTSLIAIGGALTLLRSTDDLLAVIAALPFGIETTREQWEAKTLGLAVILIYAFFKFAWSYRLFNYVAIMVGATPDGAERDTPEAQAHARRTARLFEAAGRHFNRGQRAFFLALGYLGWFLGPWFFMATTAAVLIVMWRRQFGSDSHRAVLG
jgi:uncharacterized membrane protein